MRIKKKQIEEAVLGAGVQQQTTNVPPVGDINNSTEALKNLEKEVKDLAKTTDENPPIFMKKVSENSFDPNYGRSEDLEYLAATREKLMNDYNEWLSTPEGIEYMKNMDSQNQGMNTQDNPTDDLPFTEGVKNRKVIKTIKVKDLK